MASPRIEYAVLPAGDGPGQDRCFTADGLVVVLDGASAIDPAANPDATEYVDTLGPRLLGSICATPRVALRDALAEAIVTTADRLQLRPGTAPSSTVSVVRWSGDRVDVLVLGDSPVYVQFIDGTTETIVQHPQEHIAPELRRRYRERLAAGRGYDEKHRAILAEIQRHEAERRNRPGGYFVAEADPIAADHATVLGWSADSVGAVVVATDGSELVEFGAVVGWTSECLAAELQRIHDWEKYEDPSGTRHLRSKRHDDKALAVLQARREGG